MRPETGAGQPSRRCRNLLLVCLFGATLLAYARTLACDFVYYDDGLYVFDNSFVRDGFTLAGLRHIFVAGDTGTWQPVALLSHMLDCQLYGLHAWGHHLSAILIHALNAVLLAIALHRLTGRFYPALIVATIFALHPAHVESVAWVSERKDVLSAFFWMLCLLAYERYARRGGTAWYLALGALLGLGLMTKPMLVTLPCVLFLLDYWPLCRFDRGVPRLAIEKIPLFVLVIASCIVTIVVQERNQAIVSLENLPLTMRLENVAVSYVKYIALMLWPSGLAIDYPHPKNTLAAWEVAGSCALLLAITTGVALARRRAPYALVGWLWYAGTLVPVIGFVHIGAQGMADRYTYIPSIGLTLAVVWGLDSTLGHRMFRRSAYQGGVALLLMLLAVYAALTWKQIQYWKNTEALWKRAVAVNPSNERAQRNVGALLMERRKFAEAVPYLEAAARLNPADPRTLHSLGFAFEQMGRADAGLNFFTRASRIDPQNVDTRNHIGLCLLLLGRNGEAVRVLEEAARMRPNDSEVASSLGVALCKTGRVDDALAVLKKAVHAHPRLPTLRNNYGIALNMSGKKAEAIEQFREALHIDPANDEAKRNLVALGAG